MPLHVATAGGRQLSLAYRLTAGLAVGCGNGHARRQLARNFGNARDALPRVHAHAAPQGRVSTCACYPIRVIRIRRHGLCPPALPTGITIRAPTPYAVAHPFSSHLSGSILSPLTDAQKPPFSLTEERRLEAALAKRACVCTAQPRALHVRAAAHRSAATLAALLRRSCGSTEATDSSTT